MFRDDKDKIALEDKKKKSKDPFAAYEKYKTCLTKCNEMYSLVLAFIEIEIAKVSKAQEIENAEDRLNENLKKQKICQLIQRNFQLILGNEDPINSLINDIKTKIKQDEDKKRDLNTLLEEQNQLDEKIKENVNLIKFLEDKTKVKQLLDDAKKITEEIDKDQKFIATCKNSIDKNTLSFLEKQKTDLYELKEKANACSAIIKVEIEQRASNRLVKQNNKKLEQERKEVKKQEKVGKVSSQKISSAAEQKKATLERANPEDEVKNFKIMHTVGKVGGTLYRFTRHVTAVNALKKFPKKLENYATNLDKLNNKYKIGKTDKAMILKQFRDVREISLLSQDIFIKEIKENDFNEKFIAAKLQDIFEILSIEKEKVEKVEEKAKFLRKGSGTGLSEQFRSELDLQLSTAKNFKENSNKSSERNVDPIDFKLSKERRTSSANSKKSSLAVEFGYVTPSRKNSDENVSSGEYGSSSYLSEINLEKEPIIKKDGKQQANQNESQIVIEDSLPQTPKPRKFAELKNKLKENAARQSQLYFLPPKQSGENKTSEETKETKQLK